MGRILLEEGTDDLARNELSFAATTAREMDEPRLYVPALCHRARQTPAALNEALPEGRRGAHTLDSGGLAPLVAAAIQGGDTVMVKGSLGSRMRVVVEALKALAQAPLRVANGE